MQKDEIVRIRFGATWDYLITGLILVCVAAYLSATMHFAFIVIELFALPLMMSFRGMEFLPSLKKRRFYFSFFGVRFGKWYVYPPDDELWLTRSSSYKSAHWSNWSKSSGYINWFVITIASSMGDIELNAFNEYTEAEEYFEQYAALLQMKPVNDFMIKTQDIIAKRSAR